MKLLELSKIQKPYFGYEEIARVLGIGAASAKVTASRYVSRGLLIRLKRNLYILREVWNAAGKEEKFRLANMGQTPSYISLTTALDYYGMTTQIQQHFFESVAVKRTKEIHVNGTIFRYAKISAVLYFGFKKEQHFFIATPEKALLDALYLMSYGRYALDHAALDRDKFDRQEIRRLCSKYPRKTQTILEKHGYL